MIQTVLDIDRPRTWPADLLAVTSRLSLGQTIGEMQDHWFPDEEVFSFRSLVRKYSMRVYHATRLLDHERVAIRDDGLRALSEDLLAERIISASELGLLTAEERVVLEASNAFASGTAEHRENRVCFVIGQHVFQDEPGGVESFLTVWGGEGIYMRLDRDDRARLERLGRPSIVVADVAMDRDWHAFPELLNLFVRRALGDHVIAELHYLASVPAGSVAAIWQPGSPDYDRYPMLPRE